MKLKLILILMASLAVCRAQPSPPAAGSLTVNSSTGAIIAPVSATLFKSANGITSGTGTVTIVSVATANGVSGTVATATTTPAITLALGAITPTSVNGVTFSGSGSVVNSGTTSLTGLTGSGTTSGTNTGDQTISVTGDGTASGSTGALALTVTKINGTSLAGLATGILKNTTTTGVPSIAVAGDFPTLNQNTTGSAATLTTGRTISTTGDVTYTSGSFNGSANVTGTATLANIPSATPMAGSLLATAIAAPSTPASGKGSIYVDSTSKNLAVKDDAGVVKHGVQTNTGATSNFLTAISDAGVVSRAQPAAGDITGLAASATTDTTNASNISSGTLPDGRFPATLPAASGVNLTALNASNLASGTVAAARMPALTGDITTSAGAVATTLATVASAGTTGSSTAIPVVTINAKGLTTGITTAAVVAPAGTLTGTTLASGVTASSLTSVGTLANLTVTNPITGSVTGNAATVTTNANLTGPITSSGNATSIASQTGTGTKFVVDTAPTVSSLTVSASPLTVSGNQSVAAWTTNGTGLVLPSASYTDTSSSGTVALMGVHAIGTPTLLASSATTYTDAATLLLNAAPTSSTNVTQTNSWAEYSKAPVMVNIGTPVTATTAASSNVGLQCYKTLSSAVSSGIWGFIELQGSTNIGGSNSAIRADAYTASTSSANLANGAGGLTGLQCNVFHGGTGTITRAIGFRSTVGTTGSNNSPITIAAGIECIGPTVNSASTFGEFDGISIDGGSIAGTITTRYGLKIADLIGGTTRYGVYQAGATDSNYFAGKTTLAGGIVGTTTSDNATALNVGEYISSLIASGSAVSLTTATGANVTSISLTAGDWDVSGNINFAATTATVTGTSGGITTTSATVPTDGSEVFSGVQVTLLSENDSVTIPSTRMSLSGTTTVYLVGKSTFSAGAVAAFGKISARRVR